MYRVSPVLAAAVILASAASVVLAADFEVGPGQANTELDTVPWASLAPGDTVRVHFRAAPYRTKFVICRQGTAAQPITVSGVADASGALPVVSGDGAVTPAPLNYWNEDRGVIKVGGANTPPDATPSHIVIENLEIRAGRPAYSYTGDDSAVHSYISNAAAIYLEKGENVVIRNCVLHDCGNGFFAAHQAKDVLVEGCHIHSNGIDSSIYEHNNYTEAEGIVFQFNRFGPLRANCPGNNLKDRSAGTVIRYNWIEGGNRQLDLVDSGNLNGLPSYSSTFVYGNVLIEPDGAGNSQIVHYGGDSGTTAQYRKGTLFFYNNTVVSTRAGNTTLLRLSSNDETCDCRNNIVFVTASGDRLAWLAADGVLNLRNCWFKAGAVASHSGLTGTINDLGGHVNGTDPGFMDFGGQDFRLLEGAGARDRGAVLHLTAAASHPLAGQYVRHQAGETRPSYGLVDIGAFEYPTPAPLPADKPREGGSCGLLGLEALLFMLAAGMVRRK